MASRRPVPGVLAQQVSRRFTDGFRETLTKRRTVGREAEFPVVWQDGSAADVRILLAEVAKRDTAKTLTSRHEGGFDKLLSSRDCSQLSGLHTSGLEYSLEVGWGTVEAACGPCDTLHELQERHEAAVRVLYESATDIGMRILGYGIQPRTSPSRNLMSPRKRYGNMLEAIGEDWLWFTVTASDQLHVDVTRDEIMPATNVCNMMAPLIIALCGNSPIYASEKSGVCSAREDRMARCGQDLYRHGMPSRAFASTDDFIQTLMELPFLMRIDERSGDWKLLPKYFTFEDYMDERPKEEVDWTGFLAHEHYVWHSSRPRTKQGTLELRCACQQPWDSHMSAAALQLGLVEAHVEVGQTIMKFFQHDEGAAWQSLRAWHRQAVKHGLKSIDGGAGSDGGEGLGGAGDSDDDVYGSLMEAWNLGDTAVISRVLKKQYAAAAPEGGSDDQAAKQLISPRSVATVCLGLARGDRKGVQRELRRAAGSTAVDFDQLALIRKVLECCSEGLARRGLQEEAYLAPLYDRLEKRRNPAQEAIAVATDGGMAALVDYATIRM